MNSLKLMGFDKQGKQGEKIILRKVNLLKHLKKEYDLLIFTRYWLLITRSSLIPISPILYIFICK